MVQFVHVNGDTRPKFQFRLRKDGKAISLTGCTVSVKAKLSDATTVTKSATITDAANGKCEVTYAATDLDVQGYCYLEIVVTYADTGVQHATYTVEGYIRNEYEVVPWQ